MKKLIDKAELEEIGKLILGGKLKQLEEIVADSQKGGKKRHSVMKVMFASVAIKAIAKGDANAMQTLLDRLIGKVPNPVAISNPDGTMRPQVILMLPDNGRAVKTPDEPSQS